jgi:hypothetical protein
MLLDAWCGAERQRIGSARCVCPRKENSATKSVTRRAQTKIAINVATAVDGMAQESVAEVP